MSVLPLHATRSGLYTVKPRFQALLAPLAQGMANQRVNPDVLTVAAVGCGLLGGAALGLSPQQPLLLWTIPPLVALRLGLNALDGMVATRRGVARPWGKVLNELCDRLADLAFFWPLLILPAVSPVWAVASMGAMLLVAFIGVLSETVTGVRQYGGPMGKADRMACLGLAAAATALLGTWATMQILAIVMVGGGLLTAYQRLERTHAAL